MQPAQQARSATRRRSSTALALALCVALAWLPQPRAAEVEGIGVEDAVEVDGARLELNGAGMRTVYIVKAYVAALYVPVRSQRSEVLLAQKGPRRLSLTMLADLSAEWFTERFLAALRDNAREAELARLAPRVDRLIETMLTLGQTRKGERIDIDFAAGATSVSVDGHRLGPAIPGEDLFHAILRIFVGEHPIDAELKQAMLGR